MLKPDSNSEFQYNKKTVKKTKVARIRTFPLSIWIRRIRVTANWGNIQLTTVTKIEKGLLLFTTCMPPRLHHPLSISPQIHRYFNKHISPFSRIPFLEFYVVIFRAACNSCEELKPLSYFPKWGQPLFIDLAWISREGCPNNKLG